jgi:hypothetical protein
MLEVLIIDSPVTDRYIKPGDKGSIKNNQIRVNGTWFDFDERWTVCFPSEIVFSLSRNSSYNNLSFKFDSSYINFKTEFIRNLQIQINELFKKNHNDGSFKLVSKYWFKDNEYSLAYIDLDADLVKITNFIRKQILTNHDKYSRNITKDYFRPFRSTVVKGKVIHWIVKKETSNGSGFESDFLHKTACNIWINPSYYPLAKTKCKECFNSVEYKKIFE